MIWLKVFLLSCLGGRAGGWLSNPSGDLKGIEEDGVLHFHTAEFVENYEFTRAGRHTPTTAIFHFALLLKHKKRSRRPFKEVNFDGKWDNKRGKYCWTERLNSTVSQKTLTSKGLQEERNPKLSSTTPDSKRHSGKAFKSIITFTFKGVKACHFTQGLYLLCVCVFLRTDSSSQRALALLWPLLLVPLCGLNMSRDITFIMGQSGCRECSAGWSRHHTSSSTPHQRKTKWILYSQYFSHIWQKQAKSW